MKVVGIIGARGGSVGVPGKNIKVLCGKPLIAWTIESAIKSGVFDRIIISTDSMDIATVAKKYGAEVPFLRPANLASDNSTAIDYLQHALSYLETEENYLADAVFILQPTSPFRKEEDIKKAVELFKLSKCDAVVGVTESQSPTKILSLNGKGNLESLYKAEIRSTNRQELPKGYKETGSVYLQKWESIKNVNSDSRPTGSLYSSDIKGLVLPKDERIHDIDTLSDWKTAELFASEILKHVPRNEMDICGRKVGPNHPPFVIAEIGINHEGDIKKAFQMVDDAHAAGVECCKFQSHVINDEMIPNDVVPGNADESIQKIMERCSLTLEETIEVQKYVESKGMIYMCTPFSRAAADRLNAMGVQAYKIGSGECNNYPLIKHVASFGKPIILSTGMNTIESVNPAVQIMRDAKVPFALLHCTSMYPTPYKDVRLGGIQELQEAFPDCIVGLSDHSLGNWTCFGAVSLGARILEKHFTSDKTWPGPDVPISIDPRELKELIDGSKACFEALGGSKGILEGELPCIAFAYATVVTIEDIKAGEEFTMKNIWVKRPGTGEILAGEFETLLGKKSTVDLKKDIQVKKSDVAQ